MLYSLFDSSVVINQSTLALTIFYHVNDIFLCLEQEILNNQISMRKLSSISPTRLAYQTIGKDFINPIGVFAPKSLEWKEMLLPFITIGIYWQSETWLIPLEKFVNWQNVLKEKKTCVLGRNFFPSPVQKLSQVRLNSFLDNLGVNINLNEA